MPLGRGTGRAGELVRKVLASSGVRPSKRLGQHFIVSDIAVEAFMSPLRISASEGVSEAIEVGPGAGSLTIPASRIFRKVVAVELDRRLAQGLSEILPPNVSIVLGNGVSHVRSARAPLVFSNTPFHLASEIVEAAAFNHNISKAVLGVQLEVARRMAAKPGSRSYGRLSVLVSLFFDASITRVLKPGHFYPPPEVSTAIVVLERRSRADSAKALALKLASCAFTQRNKRAEKVLSTCLERMGCNRGLSLDLGGARVWMLGVEELLRVVVENCLRER